MSVSIVCVNYNSADYTISMINSTLMFKEYLDEFIVVDNFSNIDDYNKCKEYISHIKDERYKIVRSESNLGYFGGLNHGLGIIKMKSDYVIVGNNDLIFDVDFFLNLDNLVVDKDVFALAPYIETVDGRAQNPHFDKRLSKGKILTYDIYFKNYYLGQSFLYLKSKLLPRKRSDKNIRKRIHMGFGACYILTKSFFSHYTQLNNEVFLWGEEAIFANQVSQSNGSIEYIPELKILHLESKSTGQISSKNKYEIVKKSYKRYRKYL